MSAARQIKRHSTQELYDDFKKINGQHPWMKVQPDGYVPYQVRELKTGEVTYFNFVLAKEMGLIDDKHPHSLNAKLKNTIIDTFAIQIINEYDLENKREFDKKTIKPNPYMATRYLQLQHNSRNGKTSGDGRGIWNGYIEYQGTGWDISSRGTGVTCLAPGSVEANKPLKTGGEEFGYGCGLAEIDELYGAAILAEIMHLQGFHTERVLAIIDLGKGYGIGVRAAPNLLRPAHLFPFLKQNRLSELKAGLDYLIERQVQNKRWNISLRSKNKYDESLKIISSSFAKFTAQLEIDYVFAWLDWDGDNVLADAGIIDYGSVRQFGLRHDQYRYDDVERFSTNLNEQRLKARHLIQVMAQMMDYTKTGEKKNLKVFAKHPSLLNFDNEFKIQRSHRMLYRLGFNNEQRKRILAKHQLFERFDFVFSYFEKAKISGSTQKVPDGVNHPPLFNLRPILRSLPLSCLENKNENPNMSAEDFFKVTLSQFAKRKDKSKNFILRKKHKIKIENFLSIYKEMLFLGCGNDQNQIKELAQRAERLNREDRITGNALIQIVFELIKENKKGLKPAELQALIDQLIYNHLGLPEVEISKFYKTGPRKIIRPEIYNRLLSLIEENKEEI
jgi:hypothetical protein